MLRVHEMVAVRDMGNVRANHAFRLKDYLHN
jgi:hypothetical protein